MPKKWDIVKVREFVKENSNCIVLSDEYVRTTDELEFLCKCGNKFKTTWKQFTSKQAKKKQCNNCGRKNANAERKYTKEQIEKFVSKYGTKLLSDNYENCKSELTFLCECGGKFEATFDSVKNGKRKRCFACQPKEGNLFKKGMETHNKKSEKEFVSQLNKLRGSSYKLISNYSDVKGKIKLKHECGYVWETTADHVLNHKNECPECFDTKNSKLSRRIQKWLEENGYHFEKEYTFKDCFHKRLLRFDFVIFLNGETIVIEADGEQHFKPFRYIKDENKRLEKFQETKKRDAIKNEYCSEKGIQLIRIPYYEYDSLEILLKNNMPIPSQADESK